MFRVVKKEFIFKRFFKGDTNIVVMIIKCLLRIRLLHKVNKHSYHLQNFSKEPQTFQRINLGLFYNKLKFFETYKVLYK